jgi:adenosylhomocysteine nucleosidase
MMNPIVVAFALKEEFAPWRRTSHFLRLETSRFVSVTVFGNAQVYATLVGTAARDMRGIDLLSEMCTPALGIVTGIAAGLRPQWRPGDLLAPESVVGPAGDERLAADPAMVDLAVQCGAQRAATLVTLPRIARTAAAKRQLAPRADAADMESLPLMKHWSRLGIPSLALRVILDPVGMPLTCDFEAAMDEFGQVRPARVLAQLARQPRLLPEIVHVARQSRRVLRILAQFLDRFCERASYLA